MAAEKLAPGSVIDGFTLGPLLHRGGMASLYEVTHPDWPDLPMLMKLPKLHAGEDHAAIVSFEMELMILPRLSGPHVPRCIATKGFEATPYIVMERIEGASLLPLVKQVPLPIDQLVEIGQRVAHALDDLHRQHVVHLDIKPSNILRRADGAVVLADFGLAHHAKLPDLMQEEFRLPYGTAPYMAPEQVMGVRGDPRSDIFALGVLLYFFTTGERPFGDPQSLKGLKRRIWRDPAPPLALRKDCPAWLQEIILRCLEVEPARRYPNAAQLAFDLAHRDQVALTARAAKRQRDGWAAVLRRRFNPEAQPVFRLPSAALRQQSQAPIMAVAIYLHEAESGLAENLRDAVRRILPSLPGARLACLHVQKTSLIGLDEDTDQEGRNRHALALAALKLWATPLGLPEESVTFHVLEAVSVASAILEYATVNRVDHILLAARSPSARRRWLGSVSAEVAEKAECSVTVVRPRRLARDSE
ncbi:MAG: protein kinase [Roseomonas sp.]|nr:protein kinase [Roseomonas sp.]MCA3331283.1 protein kinase [Roseomonas sp.]MCA3335965.1 protein kinase [Roseomonas sp.]MCA3352883.1 protein kinase [Roseomonas sp.]MCA3372049.1 protein kinase [Roseomonas sp.]